MSCIILSIILLSIPVSSVIKKLVIGNTCNILKDYKLLLWFHFSYLLEVFGEDFITYLQVQCY